MSGTVDTSIYDTIKGPTPQTPNTQSNPFGIATAAADLQAKSLANQDAQQTLLAKQAIGNAVQQATDPNTGQVDFNKANALVAADPNASYLAKDFQSAQLAGQIQQQQIPQEKIQNFLEGTKVVDQALAPLLHNPQATGAQIKDIFQDGVSRGWVDPVTFVQEAAQIPDNLSGADLDQVIIKHMAQNEITGNALKMVLPNYQVNHVPGQGAVITDVNPATAGQPNAQTPGMPGLNIPETLPPAEGATPEKIMAPDQKGLLVPSITNRGALAGKAGIPVGSSPLIPGAGGTLPAGAGGGYSSVIPTARPLAGATGVGLPPNMGTPVTSMAPLSPAETQRMQADPRMYAPPGSVPQAPVGENPAGWGHGAATRNAPPAPAQGAPSGAAAPQAAPQASNPADFGQNFTPPKPISTNGGTPEGTLGRAELSPAEETGQRAVAAGWQKAQDNLSTALQTQNSIVYIGQTEDEALSKLAVGPSRSAALQFARGLNASAAILGPDNPASAPLKAKANALLSNPDAPVDAPALAEFYQQTMLQGAQLLAKQNFPDGFTNEEFQQIVNNYNNVSSYPGAIKSNIALQRSIYNYMQQKQAAMNKTYEQNGDNSNYNQFTSAWLPFAQAHGFGTTAPVEGATQTPPGQQGAALPGTSSAPTATPTPLPPGVPPGSVEGFQKSTGKKVWRAPNGTFYPGE